MPTERDKKALAAARRLARTGRYINWWAIEKELESAYPEVRLLLDNKRVQERLNSLCAAAMDAKDT